MTDEKKENKIDEQLEKKVSRRSFIQGTGLTVGGLIVGGGLGALLSPTKTEVVEKEKVVTEEVVKEMPTYTEAMQFFTRKEDLDTLAAAVEVIFPEDEHGPGAIGLGAHYYIDKQLASQWGSNVIDYRKRPFEGQTPLNNGDIILRGVRKLNKVSLQKHNERFFALEEADQIAILQEFESGEIEMSYVSSAEFFALLRQLTLEGCFSDPMYGGNKNMEGWKMKEFPGAYMSYTDVIEAEEFILKEPQSMSDHM